jgi:hypothetical protein
MFLTIVSWVLLLIFLGKRKYRDAFGYDNDYEVVQQQSAENLQHINNSNWKDAYTENLFNK